MRALRFVDFILVGDESRKPFVGNTYQIICGIIDYLFDFLPVRNLVFYAENHKISASGKFSRARASAVDTAFVSVRVCLQNLPVISVYDKTRVSYAYARNVR